MKYRYEHNGKEVVAWLPSETTGTSMEECLSEIESLGLIANLPGDYTPVPITVRNAQVRQWLILNGLMPAVNAKLNDATQWPSAMVQEIAKTRFEYEPLVRRDDALVLALAADLGMDAAAMDAAFIVISQIV